MPKASAVSEGQDAMTKISLCNHVIDCVADIEKNMKYHVDSTNSPRDIFTRNLNQYGYFDFF